MPVVYKKGLLEGTRVTMVPREAISPNPDQPRRYFDPQALGELADSIRVHGILQPLSVRRKGGGRYELIAGERRLRAAALCGLQEVPCLVLEADRRDSCLLYLDFWEEARALERLIQGFGLSQEAVAAMVGRSQPAVANKLRLLKLPPEALELLRKSGATERHARALLRLPDPQAQLQGAAVAAREGWTVARTEQYVASVLKDRGDKPRSRRPVLLRDVRFFLNSVDHGLSVMRSAGVEAQYRREEVEDAILLTIRIPKGTAKTGRT